jgi:adenine-specific DNA-methyltransferase
MSIEKLKPSFHFEAERIEQLKQIAPEAFADGKIIWENLQEALGDFIDDENANTEHFGLFWPGKREARKIASTPSLGTLVPCHGEGVNEEYSKNIFIEGENLEVLKLLQKSYANRIKMIYIDPPYNTGKDFIYEDNFSESIDEYLKRTGQLDEEAKPISANTKADGRFHSKWLSMMYPRLRLARNLLNDDGTIFISIDDNEVSNLKLLMNEVFGEENFLACITLITGANQAGEGVKIQKNTEYCLVYSKNTVSDAIIRVDKVNETYRNLNDAPTPLETRLDMGYSIYYNKLTKELIPLMDYDKSKVKTNDVNKVYTDNIEFIEKGFVPLRPGIRNNKLHRWRWGFDTFIERKNEIVVIENNNDYRVVFKQEGLNPPKNYLNYGGGTIELKEIFNNDKIFDYPKSFQYIKYLISIGSDKGDIILDYFSGSGTTAHSILKLNEEIGGNRKFICIQIPEPVDVNSEAYLNGFHTIAEITKERIRKVISISKKENVGFKTLKLVPSNYKPWENYSGTNIKELEMQFEKSISPLVVDWKPENLLSEILLIEGFPLDSSIAVIDTYKQNKITQVSSDFCEHKLLVCLDDNIDDNTIKSLELSDNDIFICLDNAISDKDKVTLQDKGLIKTI